MEKLSLTPKQIDLGDLCDALALCERPDRDDLVMRVEATDCSGNVGAAAAPGVWDPAGDCAAGSR